MNMLSRNFARLLMMVIFPSSVPGCFGDEGVCSFGFWEETLFSFLGRWGREDTVVHGVRIVFHSMSQLQTVLISILYKQSLQWWFRFV